MNEALAPRPVIVERDGFALTGEAAGEGPRVVLCHGLTATRRYVLHGSRALARAGYETVAYDARGHGESDPAPAGSGYGYRELADDLAAVTGSAADNAPCVLVGHSMGAHTLAALALADPAPIAGLVVIGPSFDASPIGEAELDYWNRLADGLERGGVEGFVAAYDDGLDPEWRDVLLRISRDRLSLHRHPAAVAQALREVPPSRPFERLEELEGIDLPALVVASHDEADPGHPYAVAASWAELLPGARLISEEQGASPLAWQGGRLSREIAAFCDSEPVRRRLTG